MSDSFDEFEVDPSVFELDPREYVCQTCRLVHWRGAPEACDRA